MGVETTRADRFDDAMTDFPFARVTSYECPTPGCSRRTFEVSGFIGPFESPTEEWVSWVCPEHLVPDGWTPPPPVE